MCQVCVTRVLTSRDLSTSTLVRKAIICRRKLVERFDHASGIAKGLSQIGLVETETGSVELALGLVIDREHGSRNRCFRLLYHG